MVNKKGTVLEVFLIIVWVFAIAIALPIIKKVYTGVNESLSPQLNEKSQEYTATISRGFSVLDGMFLFFIIGLGLAAVIFAFRVDFIPIFYPLAIVIAGIAIVVTAMFSNAWEDYAASEAIATEVSSFTAMNWAMNNLVPIIVGIVFLVIIIMFAKIKGRGGGGE